MAYADFISNPAAKRYALPVVGILVGFQIVRYLNRWMSQRALNHYTSNSDWDWSKEIVVVTGGNSGIGRSIVDLLARKGITVIILDITKSQEVLAPTVHAYEVDITSKEDVLNTVTKVRSEHGHPTVLINNAGIGSDLLILDKPMDSFRKMFETNFFAQIQLVKEFLPNMVQRNHGHIITVSSMAAFSPRAANVDYAATKAALLAFNDGLNLELALFYGAKRVRTTVVHPAWVRTPLVDRLLGTGKLHQSMVTPEEVALAIVGQLYSGNSGQLYVPSYLGLAAGIKGFPHWLQQQIRMSVSNQVKEAALASMQIEKQYIESDM